MSLIRTTIRERADELHAPYFVSAPVVRFPVPFGPSSKKAQRDDRTSFRGRIEIRRQGFAAIV